MIELKCECQTCPVLATLREGGFRMADVAAFTCLFQPIAVAKDQTIFSHGAEARLIYALKTGTVKIVDDQGDGHGRIKRMVSSGSLFGLEAIQDSIYPARAVAVGQCTICAAPRGALVDSIGRRPDLALSLIRFLIRDGNAGYQQGATGGHRSARTKIAAFLFSLLPPDAAGAEPLPALALRLPLSRQEVGDLLGLSAETVSRAFTALRRRGVIQARGRRLVFSNVAELRRLAGS